MDEIAQIRALAGVDDEKIDTPTVNIDRARIMREYGIRPGSKEWFILWRHNPITGPNPYADY